jgi:hypothetical protein
LHYSDDIKKALEQSKVYESEAWLNHDTDICGIAIRQMTLYDYYVLDGIQSPFITKADYTIGDIAVFLWVLSTKHSTEPGAKERFAEEIHEIKILDAEKGILEYIDKTFNDADTLSSGKETKMHAPFLAYQVDLYAKEYGWSIEQILAIPLRQLFQLNTVIGARYAKQNGENFTKMTRVQAMEAKAILEEVKKQKQPRNN